MFEIMNDIWLKAVVFCDLMPCSLVGTYQQIRGKLAVFILRTEDMPAHSEDQANIADADLQNYMTLQMLKPSF